jgi:hypothetical protein
VGFLQIQNYLWVTIQQIFGHNGNSYFTNMQKADVKSVEYDMMGNLEFFVIGKDSGSKPVNWTEMNRNIKLEFSYQEDLTKEKA